MNIGHVIARAAKQYADNICVVAGDERITFRTANERINRLANALLGLGLEKGDRVAILMGNCLQCVEVDYAIAKAGVVRVPLNARLSANEHAIIVDETEAKAFIIGPNYVEHVESIRGQIPSVKHFIYVSGNSGQGIGYESMLAGSSPAEPGIEVDEEDLYTIQYTSGTTGRPRGVMWQHRSILASMMGYLAELDPIREDHAIMHVGQMTHAAGVFMLPHFARGARQVVMKKFDPKALCETIERDRITFTVLAPTMIYMLLAYPEIKKHDLSSLRTILYAMSPMSVERLKEAISILGPVFVQGYGLSEGNPPVTHLDREDHVVDGSPEKVRRLASCGRPSIGVEVKVVDENDVEVKPGEVGQIICRGRNVMKGYWKRPEETAQALRNGWLYTRDMATVDEAGYIYIVDRKDDTMISGGFNVYPREVEEVLYAHPSVHETAVVPVPDEKWGEAIKAVVVLKSGATATEQEIIDFCGERLTRFKKPKSVDFVDSLPKDGNGKLLRRVLREKYWQGYERRVN